MNSTWKEVVVNQTSCFSLEFTTFHFILTFAKLLLTIVATIATLFLSKQLLRDCDSKIPFYVRFLIFNVCVSYIFKNLYLLYKSLANILVHVTGTSHLHITYSTCAIEQIFFVVPSTSRHLSFLFIGTERLFKTFYFPNCNESNKLFLMLSIISLVATWILPLLLHFALLDYNRGIVCFCVLSKIWSDNYVKLFAIFLTILPLITVSIYCIVYYRNRSILSKFVIKVISRNLTERFIQWSNVKVSGWLIPVTVISLMISVSGTILALIIRLCRVVNNDTDITMVTSIIGTVYVLDNVSFPFLCVR
uniref:G-protein coupled receptors family 1 profile domain-containing protein n=1 Tax=Romanomermis culicivorax TaxID=13658 RepID=A0A915INE4_ROMCU